MKAIEYLAQIFYTLMQSQPRGTFYTTSFWVAESIVYPDMKDKENQKDNFEDLEVSKQFKKELEFIRENTHSRINLPLSIVEAVVASTPPEQWRKVYDGKTFDGSRVHVWDGNNAGRETTILDLYYLMKESYLTAVMAVAETIKSYSMDYRMSQSSDSALDWLGGTNE